jgi:TonB family protein
MTTLPVLVIEIIFKSSLVLGLTFLATLALRRQSAALRHTVWTIGLLSSLALPLFSVTVPTWYVRPAETVHYSTPAHTPQPFAAESGPVASRTPEPVPSTPTWLTSERALMLIWMIGVLTIASLLLREAVKLMRIAFGAVTVEHTSWKELVWDVSQALRLSRSVRLIRNSNASVLGTWGTLRPRVLLPRESASWSDKRMRVVLAHELAHVKRNDWLIQILAETARAVYWFNPLFWIACTHLRRESEHACDDAAMNLGGPFAMDGPTYAGHVLDLARALKHSGQPATAALAMASTSNLERRLVAMLNPSLNRRVTGKGTALIIILLAVGLTLPLAAVSSQAPLPAVPVVHAAELVIPTAAVPVPAAPIRVAPTAQPRPAVVVAAVSPVAEATPPVPAQVITATFAGRVVDPTGAVIPGVSVSLAANSTGIVRRIMTNESGTFTIADLPQDTYSGTADLPGFQRSEFSYLVRDQGSSLFVIPLAIGRMTTVIDISTQAPPGLKCATGFGVVNGEGLAPLDCSGMPVSIAPFAFLIEVPKPEIKPVVLVDSSAAAIPAPGQRIPIRVGGNLQAGNLVVHPGPAYPSEARSKGVQGTVVVSGVVSKEGLLRSLMIVGSSNPLLETSILETLQNWRYKPTLLNGEPVEVPTTISMNFTFAR